MRRKLWLVAAFAIATPVIQASDGSVWAGAIDETALAASSRGASAAPKPAWPRHSLRAEQTWQLNLPGSEPFDASGLLRAANGELWTISDRGPSLYRIQFLADTNAADLVMLPGIFTPPQLEQFAAEKTGRYDCEGIAQDEQGRIYICEEANRWVLRYDPKKRSVERLEIDWGPARKYFHPTDLNASFEGIAVGGGRLYLANERQMGRVIVVDLESLRVVDDFSPRPSTSNARDIHYTDLSWFDGALYVLLRGSRCILAVEPITHRILAEYDFREMETAAEVRYRSIYPTGQMEGLAVERDYFWLVTDNNGFGRVKYPDDIRPTLFKCRRPD
jgi:hypothetical protein